MGILKLLGIESKKEKIVKRLLHLKYISSEDAIELLKGRTIVKINHFEMSSGSRIVIGDDNSPK